MDDLRKWLSIDAPTGINELITRAVKVAVIAFILLQIKEYIDASMFDTLATGTDALIIAAGVFVIDGILMLVRARNPQPQTPIRR